MTERQFNEAAEYANKQLKDWQVAEALDFINNRMPIPNETAAILYDAMEEWCDDNGLPEGAWLEWGDIEDVFFAYDETEQSSLTDKQKASELLSFMEDEWDGKAIINALNPYLKDSDLASLYDQLVKDKVI